MAEPVRLGDAERRARLVARHRLGRTAEDVVEAVRAVVALHSSDPLAPYLGCWARVAGFAVGDLDDALYEARTLWRLHAMRRTLFVVPTDAAGIFHAAVAREVATRERRKLERWVAAEVGTAGARRWLDEVETAVAAALADGREASSKELGGAVPHLRTEITVGSGRWATRAPLASRLLLVMAMEGRIVRTRPAGSWRSSQYRWADSTRWFGAPPPPVEPARGRAELARRYLAAHGPATAADLSWWSGWTVEQTGATLRDLEVTPVRLDSGQDGYVLADDLDPAPAEPGQVALLPGLDATPMGWKARDWYLGEHGERLFDRNGNVGPTVWVDGRVVGGWAQRADGQVTYRLLADVGADASERVAAEAAALTGWMAGVVVTPRFRTPLERDLSA